MLELTCTVSGYIVVEVKEREQFGEDNGVMVVVHAFADVDLLDKLLDGSLVVKPTIHGDLDIYEL